MGLTELRMSKSKVLAGLISPSGSREESVSLPFPDSEDCLHSLAHGPPSSIFQANNGWSFHITLTSYSSFHI